MRGVGILDLIIILAVVAILVWAAGREFHQYEGRALSPTPSVSSSGGS